MATHPWHSVYQPALKDNGIRLIELGTEGKVAIRTTQVLLKGAFREPVHVYEDMEPAQFHSLVAEAQDEINRRNIGKRIAYSIKPLIKDIVGGHIWMQSIIHLRATRPQHSGDGDLVGWHRETFYGAPPQTYNLWVPVLNVTEANTLRYLPGSAAIPSEDIVVEKSDNDEVPQGSDGHKIGLLYAPKIVGGVNLSLSLPLLVPEMSAALFPGELIHGAAVNKMDKIRFSVDLRLISEKYVREAKDGYFVPINPI